MNEPFLLGLLIGGLVAVVVVRLASSDAPSRALSRLEGKLDALMKHHGVRYDAYADLAPSVLDALRRGKKIQAIKAYRVASGAGLKEAKEYIEELQRRTGARS